MLAGWPRQPRPRSPSPSSAPRATTTRCRSSWPRLGGLDHRRGRTALPRLPGGLLGAELRPPRAVGCRPRAARPGDADQPGVPSCRGSRARVLGGRRRRAVTGRGSSGQESDLHHPKGRCQPITCKRDCGEEVHQCAHSKRRSASCVSRRWVGAATRRYAQMAHEQSVWPRGTRDLKDPTASRCHLDDELNRPDGGSWVISPPGKYTPVRSTFKTRTISEWAM